MSAYEGARWKPSELRAAILVGFHFALRISEVEQLEDRDISFQEVDGVRSVTIVIKRAKDGPTEKRIEANAE